ncbi:phenylalanine--tRNA ligase subunit alpha [Ruminococcaceae bacterium OttesenSCG-928-D13]|nr:phenylalanine--tRNA ligase subunit alpha [Ruminococcaceae bacterium OttesenSCG-928-D13]
MKNALESIRAEAGRLIGAVQDAQALDALRVRFFGKKGELTAILKQMGGLSAEERPVIGALANEVREEIDATVRGAAKRLANAERAARLAGETIDVTLPGTRQDLGGRHPLDIVLGELKDIFLGMGFDVVQGPEIEYDKYNFEMLNMPKSHPSRDTQDTFYITENILLRTQTSPMQIRTMLAEKPPIRIICPGRVYRSDAADATHSPVFNQIEGLAVDKGITFTDLKGTLDLFFKQLYGPETRTRFRPHHFAYTEPSAEVDMSCFKCGGKGCPMCKGEGWIEMLGCGMVHPKVLENCGIDSTVYSGFAFGVGLERITLMRYGIDDMRLLFENDLRFLKQFKGA